MSSTATPEAPAHGEGHGHDAHGHDAHGGHHAEPNFFLKYFWSTDHKMIGMQYL